MQCVGCDAELERCGERALAQRDYCQRHLTMERERGKTLITKQERVTTYMQKESQRGQLYRALIYELKCYNSLLEIRHPEFPPSAETLASLRLCLERVKEQESNALPEQLPEGRIERLRGEGFLQLIAQVQRVRSVEVMVIRRFLERYARDTVSFSYLTLTHTLQSCVITRETFIVSLLSCLLQEELWSEHWDATPPFGVKVVSVFQSLEEVASLLSVALLSRLRQMILTSEAKVLKIIALLDNASNEACFYGIAHLSRRFFPLALTVKEYQEIEAGRKEEIDETKLITILRLLQRKEKE